VVACAYCERPLICEACQTPYQPPSSEAYEALSQPEKALSCQSCGAVLVCHWCKTPYDALSEGESNGDAPAQG
jgi:hypothetical protein